MTRHEVLACYNVVNGRITSPGRFEGEPVYAPHFWDLLMADSADGDDGRTAWFRVIREDRAEFPELGRRGTVRLRQLDSGHVSVV